MAARTFLLVATVGVLLVGACGDGGPDADGASGSAATTIEVETVDFAFEPSQWTAAADTDVTTTVTNNGESEHEWVIVASGEEITAEDQFTEEIVEFEVEAVPPGETGQGTFSLPAGTYQIICALDGHFSAGMEGELTLE